METWNMPAAEAPSEKTHSGDNLVEYRAENGIAFLTLNDPPANTYTHEMMQTLDTRILAARMDENVQVIVITGSGEKFFSAGANIQMLANVTPSFKYFFCLHANETLSRLEQTPKLVIAAINGHCVGGGLEIALAADLRIARKGAGKMGLPEVTLGVLPGTGGTQRLVRVVGKSKAIELMATGELFDFERGLELGLLNQIFTTETGEQFSQQVMDYARQFTSPHKAAHAVGRIKRSAQFYRHVRTPFRHRRLRYPDDNAEPPREAQRVRRSHASGSGRNTRRGRKQPQRPGGCDHRSGARFLCRWRHQFYGRVDGASRQRGVCAHPGRWTARYPEYSGNDKAGDCRCQRACVRGWLQSCP